LSRNLHIAQTNQPVHIYVGRLSRWNFVCIQLWKKCYWPMAMFDW